VVFPALLLVATELGLRIGGYGYPTSFFLKQEIGGRTVLRENAKFGWRFFGPGLARTPRPMELAPAKPPDALRVFVFGESAAYGDPKPDFGLPRLLEVLLSDKLPGVKVEVINVAMTGINSHVILPIARDCAGKQGDVWILYIGNNEVVGPFGSGTVFGRQTPSLGVIRAGLALRSTRVGELLTSLLARAQPGAGDLSEWQGMAMFTNNQVAADDPRMTRVYAHFERNLHDIIRLGQSHGATVVLGTVASNLKDCAPFGSQHRAGLSPAERSRWEDAFHAGVQAQTQANWSGALKSFEAAAAVDDRYAELQFRRGTCELALGQTNDARTHLVQARDCDTLRFRADGRLNEVARHQAADSGVSGVRLFDAEREFEAASPQGVPGGDLFYEHVHLTFTGNYRLAVGMAAQALAGLPKPLQSHIISERAWLSETECARRLAWTGWDQYQARASLILRLNQAPFTSQCDHASRYQEAQSRLEELLPEQRPAGLRRAQSGYQQALALSPRDWVLNRNYGAVLRRLGDLAEAEESFKRSLDLLPHNSALRFELGSLLLQLQRGSEAAAQFQAILNEDPRSVPALNGLALTLNQRGQKELAIDTFEKALKLKPGSADTRMNLGTALDAAGRKNEATEQFRAALRARLESPELLVRLGKVCMLRGWPDEAVTNLEKAATLNPADATVQWYLGGALEAKARFAEASQHFARAVSLDPDFGGGHLGYGIELARQGKDAEAGEQFDLALKLDPKSVEARVRLAISLARQRKLVEARAQFEQVLAIEPNNSTAQKYLDQISKNSRPAK
jgi:tetratricopeptide (TPR) repeat protein